jgi:HEAT repeat protein
LLKSRRGLSFANTLLTHFVAVLASGALPHFVHYLGNSDCWLLMFESAWALTNIASTDRTSVVVEAGAVPPLIALLKHDMPDLREQAGWCLGNIAGDSRVLRDYVLQQGILEPLLLNMTQPANMSLLNNVTWTVSNLCRGKPGPDMQYVQPAIQPLVELLSKEVSDDVLIDAVWALSYLSDGSDERIQTILDSGVAKKLVELLKDKDSQLLTPVVRCLGNFVTGSDLQTQAVIDAGILPHLKALLESPRKAIRKEACWLVSNIAAGTKEQIGMLFSQGGIVKRIVDNATNAPWETRKEALWAVSNICTTGSELQVQGLIQNEGLASLCSILSTGSDAKILLVTLDAITRVLEVGEKHEKEYTVLMDEYDGISKLEQLQEHPNEEVYKKTIKLLERFFSDEDADDENLAPATTETGTFSFGVSKQLFPSNLTPNFDFGAPNVLGNASNVFSEI